MQRTADFRLEGAIKRLGALDLARRIGAVAAADTVRLVVDSTGGDLAGAIAIGTALATHRDKGGRCEVIVRGTCASGASFLAMAADRIVMDRGSRMMIHNARLREAGGTRHDLARGVASLTQSDGGMAGAYAKRSGRPRQEVETWMDAERWFTAAEAVAAGLADEVRDPIATWDAALAAKVAAGLSRAAAVVALVAEDDELHTAYLAAYNERAHARARR